MNDIPNVFLLVYAALFPIVNPVGNAPIFLALTMDCSEQTRTTLARKVAVNCFFLLICSVFVGSHVLHFFGITMPILRIAGGAVVSYVGWKLLHDKESYSEKRADDVGNAAEPLERSFYPLTLPLTVGPGSISVAITLGSRRPTAETGVMQAGMVALAAVLGVAAMCLTIYLSYRYARNIVAALGRDGINVLLRLSAFILFCIGIEIIWSGLSQLLNLPR